MSYFSVRDRGPTKSQMVMNRVNELGGYAIDDRHFEIRLDDVRRVIPLIGELGVSCTKVDERQGIDHNRRACSYAVIQISDPPPKTEYDDQRNLMMVATGNKW
jgi:hypothetical protein